MIEIVRAHVAIIAGVLKPLSSANRLAVFAALGMEPRRIAMRTFEEFREALFAEMRKRHEREPEDPEIRTNEWLKLAFEKIYALECRIDALTTPAADPRPPGPDPLVR